LKNYKFCWEWLDGCAVRSNVAWRSVRTSLILFLAAFSIRGSVWLSGFWRYLGLIEYDSGFYIFSGRAMVSGLMSGDSYALLINPVHPPLGKLMLGLFSLIFEFALGAFNSGILLMCVVSSLTSLLVFKIGCTLYGKRGGLTAWAIYALDPFSIHWTIAWLDAPTLLFITLTQYLLLDGRRRSRLPALALASYYLALLTKFQAIFFLPAILIFLRTRRKRLIFVLAAFILLLLNPQFMLPGGFEKVISENLSLTSGSFQGLRSSYNLLLLIPIEFFYRVCVGYVGANVLPYLSPLILFYLLFWRRSGLGDELAARWFLLTLIGVIIAPRLLIQEYYYVYTTVPISLLISSVIHRNKPIPGKYYLIKLSSIGSLLSITSFLLNPTCWKILLLFIAGM